MPEGSDCGIPSSVKGVSNANLVRLVFFWKCVRQSSSTTAAPQFRHRDREKKRQRETETKRERAEKEQRLREQRRTRIDVGDLQVWAVERARLDRPGCAHNLHRCCECL